MDPYLPIRRGGGEGHPDPEIRRGARSQIFFSALRVSVRSTNKSRGGEGRGGGWGDFSAISTTERSSASPIPKVESHLSDMC